MAVDFQVVVPQESIELRDVSIGSYNGFAAVRVTGKDFSAVDEVLINDVPSSGVYVVSGTELVASIPEGVTTVTSVVVLNRTFTVTASSLLRFRVGKTPGRVSGTLRLVQLFVKTLFKTPGSDIMAPSSGGGFMRALGSNISKSDGKNLLTDLVVAVNQTTRQLIGIQSRDQRSARDERLLSATVTGSSFDKTQGALYVTVELLSQSGKASTVNMEL
jgi:hypothetical protein